MNNLPKNKDAVEKKIFICDIDNEAGDFEGDLAWRSIGNFDITVKLIHCYNYSIYVKTLLQMLSMPNFRYNFPQGIPFQHESSAMQSSNQKHSP